MPIDHRQGMKVKRWGNLWLLVPTHKPIRPSAHQSIQFCRVVIRGRGQGRRGDVRRRGPIEVRGKLGQATDVFVAQRSLTPNP